MKNKQLLTIIGIIVIVLTAGFYWFQYRPSKATAECQTISDQWKDNQLEMLWSEALISADNYDPDYWTDLTLIAHGYDQAPTKEEWDAGYDERVKTHYNSSYTKYITSIDEGKIDTYYDCLRRKGITTH